MVYKWSNVQYSVPAEVVGKHFEQIEKDYGQLNRENVLESARPAESPIHGLFEWDDSVAAEKYRLKQATLLICNLDVEVETEKEPITCRAYFDVSEVKEGAFVNLETAFKSEESKSMVLTKALQELRAFERKYKNLEELSELMEIAGQTIKTHEKIVS